MSATLKITTQSRLDRYFLSSNHSTSFCIAFSSFLFLNNRTLLYLLCQIKLGISQMLNYFNISGSEFQRHSVQTAETYNTLEHIHKRSVQKARFFNSLYFQIWSICIRSKKLILYIKKFIESIFLTNFSFDMFHKSQNVIFKDKFSRF